MFIHWAQWMKLEFPCNALHICDECVSVERLVTRRLKPSQGWRANWSRSQLEQEHICIYVIHHVPKPLKRSEHGTKVDLTSCNAADLTSSGIDEPTHFGIPFWKWQSATLKHGCGSGNDVATNWVWLLSQGYKANYSAFTDNWDKLSPYWWLQGPIKLWIGPQLWFTALPPQQSWLQLGLLATEIVANYNRL